MIRLNNLTGKGGNIPQYYGDNASAPVASAIDGSAYADTTLMQLFLFTTGVWTAIYNLTTIAPPTIPDGTYMGFGGLTYSA